MMCRRNHRRRIRTRRRRRVFASFPLRLLVVPQVQLRRLRKKSIENALFCGASNSEGLTARIDKEKSADNTGGIGKDFDAVYTAVSPSESSSDTTPMVK